MIFFWAFYFRQNYSIYETRFKHFAFSGKNK